MKVYIIVATLALAPFIAAAPAAAACLYHPDTAEPIVCAEPGPGPSGAQCMVTIVQAGTPHATCVGGTPPCLRVLDPSPQPAPEVCAGKHESGDRTCFDTFVARLPGNPNPVGGCAGAGPGFDCVVLRTVAGVCLVRYTDDDGLACTGALVIDGDRQDVCAGTYQRGDGATCVKADVQGVNELIDCAHVPLSLP